MAYTVLNARVKQKITTEADWIAIEDTLGVIFEGEQAFVYDDDGNPVNFKIGDGTKKFSELPYFIARYNDVANCKVAAYLEQTGPIVIPSQFRNNSHVFKLIYLNNNGATQTVKIGTTVGGSEILEIDLPNDIVTLNLDYYFTSATPVYISAGTDYSLFILYYQLDEQPVIPSGGSGTFKRWAYGTLYSFQPQYVGHTGDSWDLITGLGKAGTAYEGAILKSLPETYLRGYTDGDTLGAVVGANTKEIEFENLPEMKVVLPSNSGGAIGFGGITFGGAANSTTTLGIRDADSNPFDGQTAFSVEPKSMIVLYFTGLPTTT